jgi:hypothetical protein
MLSIFAPPSPNFLFHKTESHIPVTGLNYFSTENEKLHILRHPVDVYRGRQIKKLYELKEI